MVRNTFQKYKLDSDKYYKKDEEILNFIKHPFEFYLIPNLKSYSCHFFMDDFNIIDKISFLEKYFTEIVCKIILIFLKFIANKGFD